MLLFISVTPFNACSNARSVAVSAFLIAGYILQQPDEPTMNRSASLELHFFTAAFGVRCGYL